LFLLTPLERHTVQVFDRDCVASMLSTVILSTKVAPNVASEPFHSCLYLQIQAMLQTTLKCRLHGEVMPKFEFVSIQDLKQKPH